MAMPSQESANSRKLAKYSTEESVTLFGLVPEPQEDGVTLARIVRVTVKRGEMAAIEFSDLITEERIAENQLFGEAVRRVQEVMK